MLQTRKKSTQWDIKYTSMKNSTIPQVLLDDNLANPKATYSSFFKVGKAH